MTGQIEIKKEDNWFVAIDTESGISSQGKTKQEAISNLKEAVELYYEDNKNESGKIKL